MKCALALGNIAGLIAYTTSFYLAHAILFLFIITYFLILLLGLFGNLTDNRL